jgi:hypothetical protein
MPLLFDLPERTPPPFFFRLVLPRLDPPVDTIPVNLPFQGGSQRASLILSGIGLLAAGGLARTGPVHHCFCLVLIWIGDHLSRFTLSEDGAAGAFPCLWHRAVLLTWSLSLLFISLGDGFSCYRLSPSCWHSPAIIAGRSPLGLLVQISAS